MITHEHVEATVRGERDALRVNGGGRPGGRPGLAPLLVSLAVTAALVGPVTTPAHAAWIGTQVPGTFVVAVKAQLPGSTPAAQRQFARLAAYSFREPSTDPTFMNFRMDLWYWDTRTTQADVVDACPPGSLIGVPVDGSDPDAGDADKSVRCAARSLTDPRQTRYGTWCGPDPADRNHIEPGDVITIHWHDSEGNMTPGCHGSATETWRYSTHSLAGGSLGMIEMLGATNVDPATTFYAGTDAYRPDAVNVGWGFGSRGIGPRGGKPLTSVADQLISQRMGFSGYRKTWNNWCGDTSQANESVRQAMINEGHPWKLTSGTYLGAPSPKIRMVERLPGESHDVYTYIAVPDDQPPFTNRRIVWQSGHDFDDDGTIFDGGGGHALSGLQIIDSRGDMLGFVAVEIGTNAATNGGYETLSAYYYLRKDIALIKETVGEHTCQVP